MLKWIFSATKNVAHSMTQVYIHVQLTCCYTRTHYPDNIPSQPVLAIYSLLMLQALAEKQQIPMQ
jgi:hypothetical protein